MVLLPFLLWPFFGHVVPPKEKWSVGLQEPRANLNPQRASEMDGFLKIALFIGKSGKPSSKQTVSDVSCRDAPLACFIVL